MTDDDGPLLTKNRAGSEHCSSCCNDGWVYDGTSKHGTEQCAPCPFCEQGRRNELLHYGLTGYWQGRVPDLEQLCRCREKPAPPDQETIERFQASLEAAQRQMVGLSREALTDAMSRVTPASAGPCDDCGATAERVRFGSFDLCDGCVRVRLATQARIERAARIMRGDDDVPPPGHHPGHTTEGGTSADRG